jgi:hypothetical protein
MNIFSWEARIDNEYGCKYPENFVGEIGSKPKNEFIVSYTKDGDVASQYSDNIWDYNAYTSRGRGGLLFFDSWCNDELTSKGIEIIKEMKWIMFLLIYIQDTSRLAVSTLSHYLSLLRSLAEYAYENNVTIENILGNSELLLDYIDGNDLSKSKLISGLLKHLINIGEDKIGFSILGGKAQKLLSHKRKDYNSTLHQHALLPTRIYSELINSLMSEIDAFSEVSERYISLMNKCVNDNLLGRSVESQRKIAKKLNIPFTRSQAKPTFTELLENMGLTDYFNDKELRMSLTGASKGLSSVQVCCKLLIQIYSGMRDEECTYLSCTCLKTFTEHSKEHFLIAAKTTKLGVKETSWITSKEGAKAIKVAQQIADLIYKSNSLTKKLNQDQIKYLFVSTSYLPFSTGGNHSKDLLVSSFTFADYEKLKKVILPVITSDDIRELEKIDPYYNWREDDEFAVGSLWPLKSHQLRRSLAVYASRSGLVSLPSLRRQLQHITQEMSEYYAKGSIRAKNIIGDYNDHFGLEYQNTQSESQALSYIENVLLSDENLFGAHGTWVSRRSLNKEFNIQTTREDTIRLFKKGQMSWQETPLGGCAKIGPCDKKAMRSLIACIECKDSVIQPSKLNRLIKVQESFIDSLEQGSYEWKLELSDLEALQLFKRKIEDNQLIN